MNKLFTLLGLCISTFDSARVHLDLDELEDELDEFDNESAIIGDVSSSSIDNASTMHGNISIITSGDSKIVESHVHPFRSHHEGPGVTDEEHTQHQAPIIVERKHADLHVTSVLQRLQDSTKIAINQTMLVRGNVPLVGYIILIVIGLCCWGCGLYYSSTSHGLEVEDPSAKMGFSSDGSIKFHWAQTPRTVTMSMEPPPDLTKSNIDIGIKPTAFKVGIKGSKQPLLREELFREVNPEKSSWRLRSSGNLEIDFHKVIEESWDQFLRDRDDMPSSWPLRRDTIRTTKSDLRISQKLMGNSERA